MRSISWRKAFPFLVLGAMAVFIVASLSWSAGRAPRRAGEPVSLQGKDELLKANSAKQLAAIRALMAHMQPSAEERATLKKLEKKATAAEFEKAVQRLDRKYERFEIDQVPGIDKAVINRERAIMKDSVAMERPPFQKMTTAFDTLLGLVGREAATQDCLIPFTFQELQVHGEITGPAVTDVRQGMLGAGRRADGEYTLTNLGDTEGKGRVPKDGYLAVVFAAEIPEAGSYALIVPSGEFFIHGSTRVKGHGNFTTCYDSKVSVQMLQSLYAGEACLEYSGPWEVHGDGTRSEDRTRYFNKDIGYEPRVVLFNTGGPCYLTLYYWLLAHTACNEDGKAWVTVNLFGFPANTKHDYDTVVLRTR
ncbi:MAG: hypothetical protein A2Y56_15725 [Candidatus Aminicenantes bacterium RBG_13_63_10]|nr:MAG: hypothetical protein A2Y56_15725 [Candidatus Aminicenantes bacterium RBG_13_63_10]